MLPGETVVLPPGVLDSYGIPYNDWVHAEKTNTLRQQDPAKNTYVYVLNNHRFPKWHYGYESGSTKTQRNMKHHLVVYVFRLLPPDNSRMAGATGAATNRGIHLAMVLWRHESPGFTISSYRRTNSCRREQKELKSDSDLTSGANDVRSSAPPLGIGPDSLSGTKPSQEGGERSTTSPQMEYDYEGDDLRFQEDAGDSANEKVSEWSIPSIGPTISRGVVAEKASHLMVLHDFLSYVPADALRYCLGSLEGLIRHCIITTVRSPGSRLVMHEREVERDGSSQSSATGWMTKIAMTYSLRGVHTILGSGECESWASDRDRRLLRICANLILDATGSRKLQLLLRSALDSSAPSSTLSADNVKYKLLSDEQLKERLAQLVIKIYETLNQLLAAYSGANDFTSVAGLAHNAVSLVYAHSRFQSLRPLVSGLLGDYSYALKACENQFFRAVAAQERTGIAQKTTTQILGNTSVLVGPKTHWEALEVVRCGAWNRRWLLEPQSLRLEGARALAPSYAGYDTSLTKIATDLSLLDAAFWLHQLTYIDVFLEKSTFSIRAVLANIALPTPRSQCMNLTLDGKLHKLHALPSGVAPEASASPFNWTVSEYTGCLSENKKALEVHFFMFEDIADDRITTAQAICIRRICVALSREGCLRTDKTDGTSPAGRLFASASLETALYVPNSAEQQHLKAMPAEARFGRLGALSWTPQLKLRASYLGWDV